MLGRKDEFWLPRNTEIFTSESSTPNGFCMTVFMISLMNGVLEIYYKQTLISFQKSPNQLLASVATLDRRKEWKDGRVGG